MLWFKLFAPVLLFAIAFVRLGLQDKWHDRRTKEHKRILGLLVCLMVVAMLTSCFAIWWDSSEASDLKSQVTKLVDINIGLESKTNELLNRIKTYQIDLAEKQTRIEELEVAAAKAERGISTGYDFWGNRREAGAATLRFNIGGLRGVVRQMDDFEDKGDWEELISLCQKQIEQHPKWLTPYHFMAVAYANQGNTPKAIELLEHVQSNAPDDPEYEQARQSLQVLKNQ